jgi:hypothetical protein
MLTSLPSSSFVEFRIEVLPNKDENNEKPSNPSARPYQSSYMSYCNHQSRAILLPLVMVAQQAAPPFSNSRTPVATTDLGNKRILTSMYLPTVRHYAGQDRDRPVCRTSRREIRSNLRAPKFPDRANQPVQRLQIPRSQGRQVHRRLWPRTNGSDGHFTSTQMAFYERVACII